MQQFTTLVEKSFPTIKDARLDKEGHSICPRLDEKWQEQNRGTPTLGSS